ncbi:MAG: N-acetylmuramoyl-L-alanine amidase [Myxococcales bacterium]|nr:N-acetylmuramoyl-L-alanine amidase [Myxococcales bacterium]
MTDLRTSLHPELASYAETFFRAFPALASSSGLRVMGGAYLTNTGSVEMSEGSVTLAPSSVLRVGRADARVTGSTVDFSGVSIADGQVDLRGFLHLPERPDPVLDDAATIRRLLQGRDELGDAWADAIAGASDRAARFGGTLAAVTEVPPNAPHDEAAVLANLLRRCFTYDASGRYYAKWAGAGRSFPADLSAAYREHATTEARLEREGFYCLTVVSFFPADAQGRYSGLELVYRIDRGATRAEDQVTVVHAAYRQETRPVAECCFFYTPDLASTPSALAISFHTGAAWPRRQWSALQRVLRVEEYEDASATAPRRVEELDSGDLRDAASTGSTTPFHAVGVAGVVASIEARYRYRITIRVARSKARSPALERDADGFVLVDGVDGSTLISTLPPRSGPWAAELPFLVPQPYHPRASNPHQDTNPYRGRAASGLETVGEVLAASAVFEPVAHGRVVVLLQQGETVQHLLSLYTDKYGQLRKRDTDVVGANPGKDSPFVLPGGIPVICPLLRSGARYALYLEKVCPEYLWRYDTEIKRWDSEHRDRSPSAATGRGKGGYVVTPPPQVIERLGSRPELFVTLDAAALARWPSSPVGGFGQADYRQLLAELDGKRRRRYEAHPAAFPPRALPLSLPRREVTGGIRSYGTLVDIGWPVVAQTGAEDAVGVDVDPSIGSRLRIYLTLPRDEKPAGARDRRSSRGQLREQRIFEPNASSTSSRSHRTTIETGKWVTVGELAAADAARAAELVGVPEADLQAHLRTPLESLSLPYLRPFVQQVFVHVASPIISAWRMAWGWGLDEVHSGQADATPEGTSTHFAIAHDGIVYQLADLKWRTHASGNHNRIAVSIDMCSGWDLDGANTREAQKSWDDGADVRGHRIELQHKVEIRARDDPSRYVDYYDVQIQALRRLVLGLFGHLDITPQYACLRSFDEEALTTLTVIRHDDGREEILSGIRPTEAERNRHLERARANIAAFPDAWPGAITDELDYPYAAWAADERLADRAGTLGRDASGEHLQSLPGVLHHFCSDTGHSGCPGAGIDLPFVTGATTTHRPVGGDVLDPSE